MYEILFSIVVQGKQAVKADGTPVSIYLCLYAPIILACSDVHVGAVLYSITQIVIKKSKLNHVLLRLDKIY